MSIKSRSLSTMLLTMPLVLLCWCLLAATVSAQSAGIAPEAIFTVQGKDQQASVRVITKASGCPDIKWDGNAAVAMTQRAMPATIPARMNAAQKDNKPAVFDVLTCEASWPTGSVAAQVAGQQVLAPKVQINRIVIIADTGCRMKASENAFQPCNDPQKWPFAQVAESAAALKPDLVLHIGDIHYRESPCSPASEGCVNSPWGFGYDAWAADLFKPAKPLLEAAPWLFVRGNHEACFRAGQGWFRFLDSQPWHEARSCNEPQLDADADYSDPYAVSITPDTQFIVFDSAKTSGKPFAITDAAYGKYTAQMLAVNQLVQKKPHSFFLSHHPLLAVAPGHGEDVPKPAGNAGLQSVFSPMYPARLFPDGIDVTMHGHLHYFEALSFKTSHPAAFVLGNSASANEGAIATGLPPDFQPYPGALIESYAARAEFGFATLDRVTLDASSRWLLTEYNATGQPVFRCDIQNSKSVCVKAVTTK